MGKAAPQTSCFIKAEKSKVNGIKTEIGDNEYNVAYSAGKSHLHPVIVALAPNS